jgi:hypothetical protein
VENKQRQTNDVFKRHKTIRIPRQQEYAAFSFPFHTMNCLSKCTLNCNNIQLGFWSLQDFNYWAALKREDARQWAQELIKTNYMFSTKHVNPQ